MIEPQRKRSTISPCLFLLVVDNIVVLTVSVYQNNSGNCHLIFLSDLEKLLFLKKKLLRLHLKTLTVVLSLFFPHRKFGLNQRNLD